MRKRSPSTQAAEAAPQQAEPHPAPPAFTPVPRKCPRRDGWTPERQRAFIDALAATGVVKAAARAVNMAGEGAYMLRRQPGGEEFAAAWDAVLEHRITVLRDSVIERAIEGVEVPVVYHGEVVTTRRVYNERAATFVLRNYDGLMAGGAAGLPVRLKRIVEQEVAKARAEWEAEQVRQREDISPKVAERMEYIRQLLRNARAKEAAPEED